MALFLHRFYNHPLWNTVVYFSTLTSLGGLAQAMGTHIFFIPITYKSQNLIFYKDTKTTRTQCWFVRQDWLTSPFTPTPSHNTRRSITIPPHPVATTSGIHLALNNAVTASVHLSPRESTPFSYLHRSSIIC